jgi:DNA polymerase-3 subunit gamma/tau
VESGHDLRLVIRELSHVVRDVMMMAVDPSRAGEGELAEGERERLSQLSSRFSREDLMRAFDLLSQAEQDIRGASQPRYHFEMMLLKWMHLRKLVPLSELMEQLGGAKPAAPRTLAPAPPRPLAPAPPRPLAPAPPRTLAPAHPRTDAPQAPRTDAPQALRTEVAAPRTDKGPFKDQFLSEIRAGKGFFYNTVVAQAQRIDVTDDRVTFTFLPTHRALREQFDQTRGWLESTAERIAGRRVVVTAVEAAAAPPAEEPAPAPVKAEPPKRDLTAEAKASPAVQAMLEVFPAEIRDVEEM